jgi:hypothetical protein
MGEGLDEIVEINEIVSDVSGMWNWGHAKL